jgi:hypothetical protein
MRRLAIILTFPYLVPTTIALCGEHLWAFATNADPGEGRVSGSAVPGYYIILPLALVIQILAGVPGNLIIGKTLSRRTAIFCAILLPILPLVFISTGKSIGDASLGELVALLGIVGFFGLGTCVSFYFLYHRRTKNAEQNRG